MSSITNYKHKNMNLTSIFRICKTSKEELLKPETSLSVRQRCFGTLHVKVEVRRREASDCVDELGVDHVLGLLMDQLTDLKTDLKL